MQDPVNKRLDRSFFERDVLKVAPDLLGKRLVLAGVKAYRSDYIITETEAYRGEADLACHARKGRTTRTEVMYGKGGMLYMYIIYGMYWMMNVVTGVRDQPQAVLFRGLSEFEGPGRLTKGLGLDESYKGEDLVNSKRIWIENMPGKVAFSSTPRIGIDYAPEPWKSMPWRFIKDF